MIQPIRIQRSRKHKQVSPNEPCHASELIKLANKQNSQTILSEYEKLKPHIKNYVSPEKYQYSDLDFKEIIGVMVSASSLIRKDYTMNRVKNLIAKLKLNLEVVDEVEDIALFTIRIKD